MSTTLEKRARNAKLRLEIEQAKAQTQILKSYNFRGGYDSARKEDHRGFGGHPGFDMTPDESLLGNLDRLRALSRDAVRNNPIARGINHKMVSGVVGTGIFMRPAFNRRVLREEVGFSEPDEGEPDPLDALQEVVATEWEDFSRNPVYCDAARKKDIHAQQRSIEAMLVQCGEALVSIERDMDSRFGISFNHLHPMQLDDPPGKVPGSPELKAGESIRKGVHLHAKGYPIGYFIRRDLDEGSFGNLEKWVYILAVDEETGRPNILHIYNEDEPGQTRGIPKMASVLSFLKNIDRVNEANVLVEVLRSYFTTFITTRNPEGWATEKETDPIVQNAMAGSSQPEPRVLRQGPGAVQFLEPDEDVRIAENKHDSGYEAWLTAHLKMIGMALGIPHEVLLDSFQSSYSASRAARLAWLQSCEIERSIIITQFCRPAYQEFIWMQCALENITFPMYFDDDRIAAAYEGQTWDGNSLGLLDPKEESTAAMAMVSGKFSTVAEQTSRLTGGDWRHNAQQLAEERRTYKQLDLFSEVPSYPPAAPAK